MYIKDGSGREMLQLQCWTALVFDTSTGRLLLATAGFARVKDAEKWWADNKKNFYDNRDVRHVLTSFKELHENTYKEGK